MAIIHSDNNLTFSNIIKYPEINIDKNEFVFITGKSGCGKSTYLKLLNRTEMPAEGNIYYNNTNITEFPVLEYRQSILLVPQDNFLFPGTIKDNYKKYYEMIEKKTLTDQEMNYYLNMCCIDNSLEKETSTTSTQSELLNHDCKNLSGGEKQRVFLSIFLSLAKDVLLLDEVTSALDQATAIKFYQNLKNYAKEKELTVIAICHDKKIIEEFADKTINLEK